MTRARRHGGTLIRRHRPLLLLLSLNRLTKQLKLTEFICGYIKAMAPRRGKSILLGVSLGVDKAPHTQECKELGARHRCENGGLDIKRDWLRPERRCGRARWLRASTAALTCVRRGRACRGGRTMRHLSTAVGRCAGAPRHPSGQRCGVPLRMRCGAHTARVETPNLLGNSPIRRSSGDLRTLVACSTAARITESAGSSRTLCFQEAFPRCPLPFAILPISSQRHRLRWRVPQ